MKDELDMIFSSKDSDIEKIASRYKAVDDKRKEKIYEISQRKYNTLKAGENETTDDGFIVSAEGVERYRRPSLYRYLSAAAAVIVLFGGVFSGVMLSRSSRVQPMNSSSDPDVTSATVEPVTSEPIFSDNAVVDNLVSNFEMLEKPQYPTTDSIDLNDGIWFNKDDYAPEVDKFMNLTKYYYAVVDERIDTFKEIEDVLGDTFIYESRNRYLGGDLSSHEVGYDFKDDSMANKYVKTFISYNGKVYAQSLCAPNASLSNDFDNLYNFSNYKLVSSEFKEGGELLYMNRIMHDEEQQPVSLDKLVTCTRVYERPDGEKVTAYLQLLPENDVWKIAAFTVSLENEDEAAVNNRYAVGPGLDGKIPDQEENSEFAELQLHKNMVCSTKEEAYALTNEVMAARDNGTYKFKKINTGKYVQQLLDAGSYEELNSLENKSFLYHVVINSYRYFDTVELTFTNEGNSAGGNWSKTEHCLADNRGKYLYVDYTFDYGESYDQLSIYHYDTRWITADNRNMKCWESSCEEDTFDDEYVPDNYRFINFINAEGQEENLTDLRTVVFAQFGSDCLYLSGNYMLNFDYWEIERTEEYLGRQCAVVSLNENYYKGEQYIDMRTGIVLKSTEEFLDSGEYKEMKVTSIEVDKPLDYIYFDSTGYTDESYQ